MIPLFEGGSVKDFAPCNMEGKRSWRAPKGWGASGKGSPAIPKSKKPKVTKKDGELAVQVDGAVSAVPDTAAPSTPVIAHAPVLPVVNAPDPPPAPRTVSHKNMVGDERDELDKGGAAPLPSDDDGERRPCLNDSDGESCHDAAFGERELVLEEALGMAPATITKTLDAPSQLGPPFPTTAHWEVLTPMATALTEPVNEGPTCAPTQPEGEDAPLKFDFPHAFERDKFTGSSVGGEPNAENVRAAGIDETSHPADIFSLFLPNAPADNVAHAHLKQEQNFCTDQWVQWTHAKAVDANAGEDGHESRGHEKLSPRQFKQTIALHMANGMQPAPNVEFKLKSQKDDPVFGKI